MLYGRQENLACKIQTSTSEVHGTAQFVSIFEGHLGQGQSLYSASKIGTY